MCLTKAPKVEKVDPVAEREAAEAAAAQTANESIAANKKRKSSQSLLMMGAAGSEPNTSLLGKAKTALGE